LIDEQHVVGARPSNDAGQSRYSGHRFHVRRLPGRPPIVTSSRASGTVHPIVVAWSCSILWDHEARSVPLGTTGPATIKPGSETVGEVALK
jgi:hypothetical protein